MAPKHNIKTIATVFICLLLGVIIWRRFFSGGGAGVQTNYRQEALPPQEKFEAKLFFITPGTGELIAENRILSQPPVLESRIKLVVNELISGPEHGANQTTIPPETQLKDIYLDEKKCVYLDFDAEIKRNHPGGSHAELLTIASLVNTLTTNFPQIKQVKLLINGAEIETLAGHIDTRFPLSPRSISLTPLPADS